MVEIKAQFIDPQALLGKPAPAVAGFKPKVPVVAGFAPKLDVDPSPPHLDEEIEEMLGELAPGDAPFGGPALGDAAADKVNAAQRRYDETLAALRQRFAAPVVPTARRVKVLLEETSRAATQALSIANDLFVRMDFDADDRARFKSDFWKHVKRLKAYHDEIDGLPPDSTQTRNVLGGLLEYRIGAGPVPDGIMHLYFANQLDVLSTHGLEMSNGLMTALDERLVEIKDQAADTYEKVKDKVIETRDDAFDTANRFKWGIVGGIVGFAVLIVGSIALLTRGRGEPRA